MFKQLLFFILLLASAAAFAQAPTPPKGYVDPVAWTAVTPSGGWNYALIDSSGNWYTSGATGYPASSPNAPKGYVTPVAPVGIDPNGNWAYLQVDSSGNIKTSGGGGSTPGGTTGQLQVNAGGSPATLGGIAEGSAGYLLTSNGVGVAPTMNEPGIPTNNITAAGAYAVLGSDKGKVVKCSTSCTGFTIAQGGTGSFDALYYTLLKNNLTTPIVITPTTSTCNGAATCTISAGQLALLTINEANNYRLDYFSPLPAEHVIEFDVTAAGIINTNEPIDYSCTIYQYSATGTDGNGTGTGGTLAVDIWKANNAAPTSANKISGTSWTPLSAAAVNLEQPITGWTGTLVSPKDVFDGTVVTFTTIKHAHIKLNCH